MTLLLLDLDDTLLGNAMPDFLPAYLKGLAGRMASVADPQKLVSTLLKATDWMVEDPRPDRTLEQKFDTVFFPGLDLNRPEVQHLIDTFYREDFPHLAALTRPVPGAGDVIAQALARGEGVAVATNPLFPRTAILQRLGWAGLSPESVPFVLIPSYETFHFAKPNPAYYAEFLAQCGWPEGPVVMVGDDPEMDIEPARSLGLAVFWIAEAKSTWPGPGPEPPRGRLHDLLSWLEQQSTAYLMPDFKRPEAWQAILRATPAALSTIVATATPAETAHQPSPGEWSAGAVLCHLRDVEREVNLPRLRMILQTSNPFIPGEDTDRWAAERNYALQDCLQALQAFIQARIELLALLDGTVETDWERPARHAIFGPTCLGEMVDIITGHDRLHIRQLFQALRAARLT